MDFVATEFPRVVLLVEKRPWPSMADERRKAIRGINLLESLLRRGDGREHGELVHARFDVRGRSVFIRKHLPYPCDLPWEIAHVKAANGMGAAKVVQMPTSIESICQTRGKLRLSSFIRI